MSINALWSGTFALIPSPYITHLIPHRALQNKKHEEREMRKHKIASLKAEIACNDVLLPRIQSIHASLISPPDGKPVPVYFNEVVEKLATNPSPEAPPSMGEGMTYDGMILSLLRMVAEDAKKVSGADVGEREEKLGQALMEGLATHMVKLPEAQDHLRKELEKEEKEQKKHITSDDIHEGFENKVCVLCLYYIELASYSCDSMYLQNQNPRLFLLSRIKPKRRRRLLRLRF